MSALIKLHVTMLTNFNIDVIITIYRQKRDNIEMIHKIRIKNFYSIGKEQVIDFTTTKDNDDSVVKTKFGNVNKINCIVGNNASGKTNFLRIFTFVNWLTELSFIKTPINSAIPYYRHYMLNDEPTEIEVVFQLSNKLFRLEYILNDTTILYEKLSLKKKASDKFSQVYKVSRRNNKFETRYSDYIEPILRTERERLQNKKNSTLFSYLLITGKLTKLGIKDGISENYNSNLRNIGSDETTFTETCEEISEILNDDKPVKEALGNFLRSLDLGIIKISDKTTTFLKDIDSSDFSKSKLINLTHGNENCSFDIPLPLESEGTIECINFLLPFMEVSFRGGLLVMDEIEKSKHPIIIKNFISTFTKNNANAQLIFSTHLPFLLENRNKSQIFLVEKTDCVNSEIYRLDDIKDVRNDENFAAKYLTGKYGAIPRKGNNICK